ncbi:RNA ligase family protein [Clostridium saccharobutylicum]|uniref:DNA ligase-like protein n=1 Tax=Clostridium saccharobutylicum DSM 13864 TaxID=1345695 RepID=U5MM25_CLOSA|nr:RNA ligase family protein [Clostridium saccharobutylicum]AGX41859.1 DNA ligase-like protein [Clostridium saccharobutylicum DSM 13864]AQR89133.1 RNA ligase [Clostridium saccharobutylicum]AQR99034.1 RNA ligase [Clostridium saccharobutylicum]AQS08757.1 RNA ligase [Clostridium saccharobutylicum]AQS13022.1 RNA ligase [Clostridium saccharobutylicum]
MDGIFKYPRTNHIEGSRLQAGDEDLKSVKFEFIKDKYIVIEEKVDGANAGISFDENGKLLLQSRGHFLNGGYGEKQFSLFKLWANTNKYELERILGDRYVMYGEWLYAKHTVFYDELTHYFMEFDIYDKVENKFLSTKKRREILNGHDFITSVLVLYEGKLNKLKELTSFLGKSNFKSENCKEVLRKQCDELKLSYDIAVKQTDISDLMEGLYIKVENKDEVIDRFKYVRSSFLNTILDSETHWVNRPIIPNKLKSGVELFSSGEEV